MAKVAVRRYPMILTEDTEQARIWSTAIVRAMYELSLLPDGDMRRRAVDLIYFKKTSTIDGAALSLHVSRSTIKRWTTSFIYAVGKHAGYI